MTAGLCRYLGCWRKPFPAEPPSLVWYKKGSPTPHAGVCLSSCLKCPRPSPPPNSDAEPALSARFVAAFPGVRTRGVASMAPEAGGSRASGSRQRRGRLCHGPAILSVAQPRLAMCGVLSRDCCRFRHFGSGTLPLPFRAAMLRVAYGRLCAGRARSVSPARVAVRPRLRCPAQPGPWRSFLSATAPHGHRCFHRHGPAPGRDCLHS